MTCHRLTSERKSYDWLPLLCLRLRYHGNVYGQRKYSLLVRDYPFVWQRHANPYDFCLLFRPLSLTHMIFTSPCVPSFYLRTGCSPQGRTFLFARCRHAFWKFLSLSFLLLLSAAFLSLSLSLSSSFSLSTSSSVFSPSSSSSSTSTAPGIFPSLARPCSSRYLAHPPRDYRNFLGTTSCCSAFPPF